MRRLISNEKAYQTFAAWIGGGRLPHAILLEGPSGCGKSSFAAQLAQAALCEAEDSAKPCLTCRHCIKMEKDAHPDFLVFQGEGRARSFHIETVREIRSRAHIYPNEALRKVFLLKNVQDMSVQAQNALLKTLEEPPETALFILTCENKSALLETILSRVFALTLEVPSSRECAVHLTERLPDASPEACRDAAGSASGNVGRALELLQNGGSGLTGEAHAVWQSLLHNRELDALAVLSKYDRDRASFLELLSALRSLAEGFILVPSGDSGGISPLRLMKFVDIIDEIAASCAGNVSVPLLACNLCAEASAAFMK